MNRRVERSVFAHGAAVRAVAAASWRRRLRAVATWIVCWAVLWSMAPAAWAGDAATVRVSATVLGVCKIASVDDIRFGELDPSRPVDVEARGAVRLLCTRGVDYRLVVDAGQSRDATTGLRRMRGGGAFLPYTLTAEDFSGVGAGFRTPIELPLTATVHGDDYRDLPAAHYDDVIRVVLEP